MLEGGQTIIKPLAFWSDITVAQNLIIIIVLTSFFNFQGFLGRLAQLLRYVFYDAAEEERPSSFLKIKSDLKSRIPWDSTTLGRANGDRNCISLVDAVKKNRAQPNNRQVLFDLYNTLQDMAPFYLPKRYRH